METKACDLHRLHTYSFLFFTDGSYFLFEKELTMNRYIHHTLAQKFVHLLIATSMLLSLISPLATSTTHASPNPIANAQTGNPAPTPTPLNPNSATQNQTYPSVGSIIPWNSLGAALTQLSALDYDGEECNLLAIPGNQITEPLPNHAISNMADFNANLIWTDYSWVYPDGAQIKLFKNNLNPKQVIVSMAGSTPAFWDSSIEDLFENGFSQSGYGNLLNTLYSQNSAGYIEEFNQNGKFGSDYLQLIYLAVKDAVITNVSILAQESIFHWVGKAYIATTIDTAAKMDAVATANVPTAAAVALPKYDTAPQTM